MTRMLQSKREFYSEFEAALHLGISIHTLHALLDQHIFNDGTPRPGNLTFRDSDLLLLAFWNDSRQNSSVVPMPRRA